MAENAILQSMDTERLARWLDAEGVPGSGEPLAVTAIGGGSQNELYELRRGAVRLVLRGAPRHAPAERSERMMREYQRGRALADRDVPHARVHAGPTHPHVVGTPCYAMDP